MGNDRFDVSDRVIVITGAGQGLGREYALAFAKEGATPVLAEINGENMRNVAAEIEADGGTSLAVETDVSDPGSVNAMVAAAIDAYGRVDVLINNAAIFATLPQRPFYEIPFEERNKVMQVNITGSYLCSSAVAKPMKEAGQGRIINISSGTVPQGVPGFMHYVTSKSAIIGMTRVMARELSDDNINVNTLMPGYTTTEVDHASMDDDLHEFIQNKRLIKRAGTPDDLIGAAMFLASPASSFISGQTLAVCGGEVMI
ncbi:MAG: SDR family oxidoreductase [Rhodospirillaceae bacterium]|nr:SDR family oxidoreductase [Rhodospirillaceae bacterium]